MLLGQRRQGKPGIMGSKAGNNPPFLIAGQGLAGSLLAHALDRLGAGFHVVDPGGDGSATRAAAGLLNPFTGPRFKAPSPIEVWFRSALAHWRLLEHRLNRPLLHTGPLVRLIRDERELETIRQRRQDPQAARLIDAPGATPRPGLNAPLGCVSVRAGQVDLPAFLDGTRAWLKQTGRLIEAELHIDQLDLLPGGRVRWQAHPVHAVIACLGFRTRKWPWFAALPWRMSHGQALIVQRQPALGANMLSRGKNLIPLDHERMWLGATYDRHLEPTRDEAGRSELLQALENMLPPGPEVIVLDHVAGVRAGNRQGMLFCGRHPDHPGLALLGGLGSRGTLLAPAAASALASHLVCNTPLPPDWDLRRYLGRSPPA
jgi:glycine/D-amino acid oxidase-like deaminating enzyme